MKKYISIILLFSAFFFALGNKRHSCFEKTNTDRASYTLSSNSGSSYGYSHTDLALYANHISNVPRGNNRTQSVAGYLGSVLLRIGYDFAITFGPNKSLNNLAHKNYLLYNYPSHHFW